MGNAGREICRRAGISQAIHFNWNGKYDGPLPPETRPFEQFENENGKLRKLVVDLSCGREILRDVIRSGRLSATAIPADAPGNDLAIYPTAYENLRGRRCVSFKRYPN